MPARRRDLIKGQPWRLILVSTTGRSKVPCAPTCKSERRVRARRFLIMSHLGARALLLVLRIHLNDEGGQPLVLTAGRLTAHSPPPTDAPAPAAWERLRLAVQECCRLVGRL